MGRRFIIYGAGAVGGVLGGRMAESGADVVLIARGAHRQAIARDGLTLESPAGTVTLRIPVVEHPRELEMTKNDVVVLTMKSQDTMSALHDLAPFAPVAVPIVCAQNGVANEEMALRHFPNVYGCCVVCATTYLAPGHVVANASPPLTGIFDLGRFPNGLDDTAGAIADAFTAGTWKTVLREDVMVWKYTKLLRNLQGVIQALCGPRVGTKLFIAAKVEGAAAIAAAGQKVIPEPDWPEERNGIVRFLPAAGHEAVAGSTWQSVVRGAGSLEVEYLNGEISLLGRLHGVATPINDLLGRLAVELMATGADAGSYSEADIEQLAGIA